MITPLNVKEACAAIPCSESTLRRLNRQGKFKGITYRVGKRLFFLPDKLDEWKRNGGTAQFEESA